MSAIEHDNIDYSHIAKVLLVGDSGTGKSSLFNQMLKREFCEYIPSTIGVDFHSLIVKLDVKKMPDRRKFITADDTVRSAMLERITRELTKKSGIKLQIWDAAGQEKFHRIIQNFYKNASIIIIVFDLFDRSSFDHLPKWLHELGQLNDFTNGLPLIYLIGNKRDLETSYRHKAVTDNEIENFCNKYNIVSYHPLSAKTDASDIQDFVKLISHDLFYHVESIKQMKNFELKVDNTNLERNAICCNLL